MNTNHDQITGQELARALHGQVDGMTEAPLTLADVRGRAHSIRRTRRVAMGAGVAAALAVLVPTAILANNGFNRSEEPSPLDGPIVLTGSEPVGAPPVLGFVDISGAPVWHAADGTEVPVPHAYYQLVSLGDQAWGLWSDDSGTTLVDRVQADGTAAVDPSVQPDRYATLQVSEDHNAVAWLDDAATLQTLYAGATAPVAGPTVDARGPSLIALVGDCRAGSASCTAYLNTREGPAALGADGSVTPVGGPLVSLQTASPEGLLVGRVAELVPDGPNDDQCAAAYDPGTGSEAWRDCRWMPLDFSPSGAAALAIPTTTDGVGPGALAIIDGQDGSVLVELDGGTMQGLAWEDDTHALVSCYVSDVGFRMFRVGVDGSVERAGDLTSDAQPEDLPWRWVE